MTDDEAFLGFIAELVDTFREEKKEMPAQTGNEVKQGGDLHAS